MRRWLVVIEDDENVLGRTADVVEANIVEALDHDMGIGDSLLIVAVVGKDPEMTTKTGPGGKFFPKGTVHYGAVIP